MKTEFLESLGLEKEVIDKIMAENGKDIEKLKYNTDTQSVKVKDLESKLEEANNEIQGFKNLDIDGIKKRAEELEKQYNADKEAWENEKKDREYTDVINGSISGVKFSSESAKKAFIGDLKSKGLAIEEGKFLGFDDYIKKYKADDPGAFINEDENQPIFVKSTNNNGMGNQGSALRAAFGLSTE